MSYCSAVGRPEEEWIMLPNEMLLKEFPVLSEITYLNSAAQTPVPMRTVKRIQEITEALTRPHREPDVSSILDEARRNLAALMNARQREIAFIGNTSEGISLAASSLPLEAGDNVVIPDPEHPTLIYPWLNLRSRGVIVRQVPWTPATMEPEDLLSAVDDRTRVVALSHVQWVNGFRHDLAEIGGYCRERGIYLVVDAIQSLGVLPVDVREANISVLAAGGYKWLMAGRGNGCLFVSDDVVDCMRPLNVGRHGVSGVDEDGEPVFHGDARRFFTGAWNLPGLAALATSAGMISELGLGDIAHWVLRLTGEVTEGLRDMGLELTSPREERYRSGIVSFTTGHEEGDACLVQDLSDRGVYVALRPWGVRASMHFFNTEADVTAFLGALHDVI